VKGIYAGEALEGPWAWLRGSLKEMWGNIEKGKYSFGSEPAAASAGAVRLETRRASP